MLLQGLTALHDAIYCDSAQTARALLAHGADANLVFPEHDNDGQWPQARSPAGLAY